MNKIIVLAIIGIVDDVMSLFRDRLPRRGASCHHRVGSVYLSRRLVKGRRRTLSAYRTQNVRLAAVMTCPPRTL